MATQTLDCLVIGNEPAGLWLLKEYRRLFEAELAQSALSALSKKTANPVPPPKSPRLGWLQVPSPGHIASATPLAVPIAQHFGIVPHTAPFSAEIVSKRELVHWTPQEILKRFPELPADLPTRFGRSLAHPNSQELSALRAALERHPEIIKYSAAIWKIIGRSRKATVEQIAWAALMAHQFYWWQPELGLESIPDLARYTLDSGEVANSSSTEFGNSIARLSQVAQVEKCKDGSFSLSFDSGLSLNTQRIILNLPLRIFEAISLRNSTLVQWAGDCAAEVKETLSRVAVYPLDLEISPDVLPKSFKPITLYLDSSELPEPDSEIWPMELNPMSHNPILRLWVSDRYQFSLESLTDKLRVGYSKASQLFPALHYGIKSLSIPMGVETCHTEEQRRNYYAHFEEHGRELYSLTFLHPQTRQKRLHALFPSLNCTLPYPLGTLFGASEILTEIFGKKRMELSPRLAEAPPHFHSGGTN